MTTLYENKLKTSFHTKATDRFTPSPFQNIIIAQVLKLSIKGATKV